MEARPIVVVAAVTFADVGVGAEPRDLHLIVSRTNGNLGRLAHGAAVRGRIPIAMIKLVEKQECAVFFDDIHCQLSEKRSSAVLAERRSVGSYLVQRKK